MHFMSKPLALIAPPDAAAKILFLARVALGRNTDTDAPPFLRSKIELLACWKGIRRADDTAALKATPRDKAWNFIAKSTMHRIITQGTTNDCPSGKERGKEMRGRQQQS